MVSCSHVSRCGIFFPVLMLSAALGAAGPSATDVTAPEQRSAPSDTVPLEELREFARVYAGIRAAYVDEVDGKRLLHAATVGMLRALDPHSEYYDAKTLLVSELVRTRLRLGILHSGRRQHYGNCQSQYPGYRDSYRQNCGNFWEYSGTANDTRNKKPLISQGVSMYPGATR